MKTIPNCDYHIAVAGGGLAGLTLAIQAADAGYRVALFEKEDYPFHKVCGEYISMESHAFLASCGFPFDEWELPQVYKLHVSDTFGNGYDFPLSPGGFGISRYTLDHALCDVAKQKGVAVFTSAKIQSVSFQDEHFVIQVNERTFTSKVAVGSFGKHSNLDVKLDRAFIHRKPGKINQMIGVKYHIRYAHDPAQIVLHNFSGGYCGMSAIEDGKSCLCYLTTAENLKKSGNSIPVMEKNILYKNSQLKKIFEEAEFIFNKPVTISQISFDRKTLVEDHILMVGDAAGMITPLCGNGMSMAMHASKLAFNNIRSYLDQKTDRSKMEQEYRQQWNREFAFRTRVGRIVQSLFGDDRTTAFFLKTMDMLPFAANALIRRTHGKSF